MINIFCLVCDLQAGTAHTEVHAVHINLTRVRLSFGGLAHVRVLILVQGHLNVDLLLAALVDRLRQTEESRMRTRCLLWYEALMRVLVRLLDSTLVGSFDIPTLFLILGRHGIGQTKDGASRS